MRYLLPTLLQHRSILSDIYLLHTFVEAHKLDFMPKVSQYLDVPFHLSPKHANKQRRAFFQLSYGFLSSFLLQFFDGC